MRTLPLFAALPLAALAACNTADGGTAANTDAGMAMAGSGEGGTATAMLRTSAGADAGMATIAAQGADLAVRYQLKGLPPGVHAVHVHTAGRCDAPTFETAGGHWNPTTQQHGSQNPQGPHKGDMPNTTVAADGTASGSFTIRGAMMSGATGLLDADGAAFMVHAAADDYRTDPSGNAGGRIACGVLTAS